MTTEKSALCVFSSSECGDSVALVTPTATFLSIVVDIEWETIILADSVILSNGVTVLIVFHFEGWTTKTVMVCVVLRGSVRASSVRTDWGFASVSLEAILLDNIICRICMRPCVVSSTEVLFLIELKPMIGPLTFFKTTKC